MKLVRNSYFKFRLGLVLLSTLASFSLSFADEVKTILEQSLIDYTASFRIELRLLTDKIQNAEAKRNFLKTAETAITKMQNERNKLDAATKIYLKHQNDKNLVTRLRTILDVRRTYESYFRSLLFSNTAMNGITSYTRTFADEGLDNEFLKISTALMSFGKSLDKDEENILKLIETAIATPSEPI